MANYTEPTLRHTTSEHDDKRMWFVAFMFTDSGTGKRKQFQYRGEINKQPSENEKILEGNAFCAVLLNLLKAGWNPFDESPGQFINRQKGGFINRPRTLGETLAECYNLKQQQLTGNESTRTYKYIYEHFRKWIESQFLDRLKPDSFTVVHAMAYSDQLIKEGKKGRGFNNYRSIIKVLFNMMVDREVISKNPFAKIKPAKVTEAEIVPFRDLELKQIREYLIANDYNLYVFTQFIFYLLLRPIEILSLQVKHIDLTRNKINLPAIASKNRKSRSCNIPPALKVIITGWLKYGSINDYLFGKGMATGPIKINRRDDVTDRHRLVLDELGVDKNVTLYSYKYSGVISAYLAGISIEEIRLQAGHHSIEMTQIYMQKLGLLKANSFGSVDY